VRFSEAVATAPPGSARFAAADLARLGRATLNLLLAPGPCAPPLEDVAAALGDRPRRAARRRVGAAAAPARAAAR